MQPLPTNPVTPQDLLGAVHLAQTPAAYRELLAYLVEEGRTTGPDQGEEMVAYTRLNLARTVRNEKTVKLLPEVREALVNAPAMHWLVLTEPWCGDSSQVMPVLVLMAAASPNVQLSVLLRDEHLPLMDHYLTNGTRSIPKLVAFTPQGQELFTWGPRPQTAQDIVLTNKALPVHEQLPKQELYAKVHGWYAEDRGRSIQLEVLSLLGAVK